MPANDLEVFDHLTSNEETPVEIDYLTYALFAWKKQQWVEHFVKQNSQRPTQAQIDAWINQLPDSEYEDMRSEAVQYFDAAAKLYLADQTEEEKKKAISQSILAEIAASNSATLAEIKQFTSPWKHVGIALAMAVVAPLLLGGLIFLYTIFDNSFHLTISRQEPAPAKLGNQ